MNVYLIPLYVDGKPNTANVCAFAAINRRIVNILMFTTPLALISRDSHLDADRVIAHNRI